MGDALRVGLVGYGDAGRGIHGPGSPGKKGRTAAAAAWARPS